MINILTDTDQPDDESGEPKVPLVEKVVEKAPPWLFSTAIHFALMIVLALIVSQLPPKPPREIILQPNVALIEDPKKYDVKLGDPNLEATPVTGNELSDNAENPTVAPEDDPLAEAPVNRGPEIEKPNAPGVGTERPDNLTIRSLYDGRSETARRTAMTRGGGDETTEAAVIRGLHWLARQQFPDGHWSLRRGPRKNSYDAAGVDNWTAATGMALLAFQGHGETTEQGEFRDNVRKGWSWLLTQQDDDGCFFRPETQTQDHLFYTQGICTIAICELYAMTRDPVLKEKLRLPAQKALDYCVKHQTSSGGWKYGRNDFQSDLSVTGWVLMALQSGRIAGLDVPEETLDRVGDFLDDIGEAGSKYPYEKGSFVTRSMTAEGLLCRQFLGWERDDPRLLEGADWLIQPDNLVCFTYKDEMGRTNGRDVYYWYYATQMFHHLGGRHWKTWNDVMKQNMCEYQQARKGENEGSWDPTFPSQDRYAGEGRLYVTCLSIYILEVYYRHLPIYRTSN